MTEKLIIGFVGAFAALAIREIIEAYKRRTRRQNLAALCVKHLSRIRHSLKEHVQVDNKAARFGETQYWEIVVGDFLYDFLISNVDAVPDIRALDYTVTFFHHYKVNMATLRARLDSSGNQRAQLTNATYQKLMSHLDQAIKELEGLASKGWWSRRW